MEYKEKEKIEKKIKIKTDKRININFKDKNQELLSTNNKEKNFISKYRMKELNTHYSNIFFLNKKDYSKKKTL